MLSERRLDQQGDTSQVFTDSRDATREKHPNIIGMLAAAAAGYGLYRTGALKGIIRPMMEVADTIAHTGGRDAAVAMKTIKKWSNLKRHTPEQLAFMKYKPEHAAPGSPSIFRMGDRSLFESMREDVADIISSGNSDFKRVRDLMKGSEQDIMELQKMLDEELERAKRTKTGYLNSTISHRLDELNSVRKITEGPFATGAEEIVFKNRALATFMDNLTESAEEAHWLMQRTGARHITLGDIMDIYDGPMGFTIAKKSNAPINIEERDPKYGKSLSEKIEKTFFDSMDRIYIDSEGKRRDIVKEGTWKNIILDEALMLDETGRVIDYRMARNDIIGFVQSLGKDFKLPVVQFNPLQVLGFDKFGQRKPIMGIIGPNQFDPNITGLAGRRAESRTGQWLANQFGEEFKNANIGVFNGEAFAAATVNGKLVQHKLASGLELRDITYAGEAWGIKPLHNAMRQMQGLEMDVRPQYANYIEYAEANDLRHSGWNEFKYDILNKRLGIGRAETRPRDERSLRFDEESSVDAKVDDFLHSLSDRFLRTEGFEFDDPETYVRSIRKFNYKSVFGTGIDEFILDGEKVSPKMVTSVRKGIGPFSMMESLINALETKDNKELKDKSIRFVAQFSPFTGQRRNGTISPFMTEGTGAMWFIPNQISEGLNLINMGLPTEMQKTPAAMWGNLLLRRALPFYLLTQVPDMINYVSEPIIGAAEFIKGKITGEEMDNDFNPDNLSKVMMRDVVKPIDLGFHTVKDITSATEVFKFLQDMVPGFDQIEELPGIHALGLTQNREEREHYIEEGYDPIRKGRWWGSGNTPLTGGKIDYWRPNLYRRVEADVDFSDSKYGSRQEYFNNTWYPNLANPLAPLNHFFLNKHYFDKKHYMDRPYLTTAPEGSEMPLIGPAFSSTIGSIISPKHKMHSEYWDNGRPAEVNPLDELPSPLLTSGTLEYPSLNIRNRSAREHFNVFENSLRDYYTNKQVRELAANSFISTELTRSSAENAAQNIVTRSRNGAQGLIMPSLGNDAWKLSRPYRNYDRYDNPYDLYVTPSGQMEIVDVPDDMNLYDVNSTLQGALGSPGWSINKITGTQHRIDLSNQQEAETRSDIDSTLGVGLGEQYNWVGEIAGLRGFAVQQFVTGHPNEDARVIENSGYAYSASRDFWDSDLGGLGGGLSEIFRRFIPKKNNSIEEINPIRNTMPSWMPGSNYFIDFKHGDPYTKVHNGEERLPGEGYERLHGIDDLMRLGIGSSSIGYEKDYIVKHMLNQDDVTSKFEDDTLTTGTQFHDAIEQMWLDAGIAIDVEKTYYDNEHNIQGTYDALVKDPTSPTGQAIVDIKTTSAKKLKEIKRSGEPLEHHKKQVNWYLNVTGNQNSKGYIYYVDKENPENVYTVGFNYDQDLYNDTIKNVEAARDDIRKGIETGQISRGDLYSPIDKMRILADVAPYSQEYKDAATKAMADAVGEGATEKKAEMTEIRERVKKQKEPLRVYDYKFSTANLDYETARVTKVLDNGPNSEVEFMVDIYGHEHAVKLAGVRVSKSSKLWDKTKREETFIASDGRKHKHKVGLTEKEAAEKMLARMGIRPGGVVRLGFDADERNKFTKDTDSTVRAVVYHNGMNVNQVMLNSGLAKEKEKDDSPAAIHARYTEGEIAFGSAMETVTHKIIGSVPIVGTKIMQVRSPYEMYKEREVYGKDFQSWNRPITGILQPHLEQQIGDTIGQSPLKNVADVMLGAFIGSMFGRNNFGRLIGATVGGGAIAVGKLATSAFWLATGEKDRAWRPKRRREQEDINEYVDTLKYVKNMRLYERYKNKAMRENHFDVDRYLRIKEAEGKKNKRRIKDLSQAKKERRMNNGKYDPLKSGPLLVEESIDGDIDDLIALAEEDIKSKGQKPASRTQLRKEIKEGLIDEGINSEINYIRGRSKVEKLPENALKAIQYKEAAERTMYGYDPGDSIANIMTALPKKDRQYFKHFMNAPEEEKIKILQISPRYMRRALQSVWGMHVDEKPTLEQYFTEHALPDENWVGWREDVPLDAVKVKIVDKAGADPGEFDIWDNNIRQANAVNIPIPRLNASNNPHWVEERLRRLVGRQGMTDIQVSAVPHGYNQTSTSVHIRQDMRAPLANKISNMEMEDT